MTDTSVRAVVDDPAELGLDPAKLEAVVERARREIDAGILPSCQLAIARNGRLALFEALGEASLSTRYVVWSCTKAVVAAATWLAMGDGALDVTKPVVDYFPEFGTNGKDVVIVEQLLTHTAGFPQAPMRSSEEGLTREGRIERMKTWRLTFEPGTRFWYHTSSAHWVLREVLERVTSQDLRGFVRDRIALPLGLPDLKLGAPIGEQDDVADVVGVGEPLSPEQVSELTGGRLTKIDRGEVTVENLVKFNWPEVRALGWPGGGGVMSAADLALFYQALLHNPGGLWDPEILADGTGHIRVMLPDPMLGTPAHRSLGLMIAGDDTRSYRGFGKTNSPRAFGHGGAFGQIGWADPDSGISFAYCTNGLDENFIREASRGIALSSRAAVCLAS